MKVVVYVEGPSDVAAMRGLFHKLIESKREGGIAIEFVQAPPGDKKVTITTKVPIKAADIICADPSTLVAAIPDLYPPNRGVPHRSFPELETGMRKLFVDAMKARKGDDERLLGNFRVFCFKHDLEALVLAAEGELASRLGVRKLKRSWADPVEEQNHDRPPKLVVRDLFREHGERYKEAIDAPLILGEADYEKIAELCPQSFKPFVAFLTSLPERM